MCLAIPGKVVELKNNGKTVVVEYVDFKCEATNVEKVVVGEWVLVQQGMVIEKLSKEEIKELKKKS